jgi:hypothetical protein
MRYEIPIVAAIAVGISYFIFLVFVTPFMDNATQPPQLQQKPKPAVSTVVFIGDATQDETLNHGIYPNITTVIIGVNNTVRWLNQDAIPHGFLIPNDENIDPDFTEASLEAYGDYTRRFNHHARAFI